MDGNNQNRGIYSLENIKLPLRIVTIYLGFGALWIVFSDSLLGYLVSDAALYVKISTLKGWLYVAVTGILLFNLISKDFLKIQTLNQVMEEKNRALVSSNVEIRALYEEMSASEECLQSNYEELERYKERLEASDERYRLVMKASQEGFWDYRVGERKLEISDGFSRILGSDCGSEENLVDEIAQRIHPEDRHHLKGFTGEEELPPNEPLSVEMRIRHENGNYRWALFHGLALRDDNGVTHRIIGAVSDIHEKMLQRERIEYYAFHDPATGFHNRDYMLELLSRRITPGSDGETPFVFLVAGIQGMERLSSVYGTNITEIIHYQIGMSVWKAIGDGGSISMLGLGRFGVVLEGGLEERDIQKTIDAVEAHTNAPIRVNQLSVSVHMAYGAVRYSGNLLAPETLVQQAETAFTHAGKLTGRNHVVWYEPAFQEEKNYLGRMEFLLRQALDLGEFRLVYQPQASSGPNAPIEGYEALLRWNSPELGAVSPEVFIPVAEATGMIEGIGEFVVSNACRFIRNLMDYSGASSKVSINASMIELINSDYIDRLIHNVTLHGLRPENICIEITETALAKYLDSVIENLNVLRGKGFEIHLDDFGTGYSSLNHLGRLPVNAIKIDRIFVWQMEKDLRMHQMTELIIKVGHQLDMRIIAEGVETEAQLSMLQGMGCDLYQGYLLSKPVSEEDVLKGVEKLN